MQIRNRNIQERTNAENESDNLTKEMAWKVSYNTLPIRTFDFASHSVAKEEKRPLSALTPFFFLLLPFLISSPNVFVYHIRKCDRLCDSVVAAVIGSRCHILGIRRGCEIC